MDSFRKPDIRENNPTTSTRFDLLDGRWLVPLILLHVRNGDAHAYDLAGKLVDLGLNFITPRKIQHTLRRMKKDGLVLPDHDRLRSGAAGGWYRLTGAGESHLYSWAEAVEQHRQEVDAFLQRYKAGPGSGAAATREKPAADGTDRPAAGYEDGREGGDATFVLAAGRLRLRRLRPETPGTEAAGEFLGHPPEELVRKDIFKLVHREDLAFLKLLISLVAGKPGAQESTEVRFRDAAGDWRLTEVSIRHVPEDPAGGGELLLTNVREVRKEELRGPEK